MDGDVSVDVHAARRADAHLPLSGFGSTMANTPLVILWQLANGTTVLSQRQASGRVEPLPVTHPPRLASLPSRANIVRLDASYIFSCLWLTMFLIFRSRRA